MDNKSIRTKRLSIVALSLAFLFLYVFSLKSGVNWGEQQHAPSSSRELTQLKLQNQHILEKLAINDRKITFLGMVSNNNFVITKNDYEKKDLVFFNEDWTLDQMPQYINLSQEDMNYLRQFVR